MNDRVYIGIIDSGIDENEIDEERIRKKYYINCNSLLELKDVDENAKYLKHGTICALVIEKYCLNCSFLSIRILNNCGRGSVKEIASSLDSCYKNDVILVNVSLGSTFFRDKKIVRRAINHYANKGLIIVAASSNDGYITYPASLSNVISVAWGDSFCVDENLQSQKGIDFIAPSDHEISMEGVSFRLGKSNSYAAPYVTAMVGNLIYEEGTMTVNEIRESLSRKGDTFIYSPDWIEAAWITPNYKKCRAEYYFIEDNRRLQDCFDDIDTIVISNPEEAELYAGIGKHIVYIGLERIVRIDKKHHFWCKEMRIKQIMSAKERTAELGIPVIYCIFDNTADAVWCLCELKRLFAEDGYNAFAGYSSPASVLYDLEYLPQERIIQEKTADFIYWQTYYQQSDLVLTGYSEIVQEKPFVENPDMIIVFDSEVCGYSVRIVADRDMELEKQYPDLETESIKKIYDDIIWCFEKEDE